MKTNPNRFWIIVILLGWAFDFLFWKKPVGINFAIYATLCLGTGILLLRADGLRFSRRSGLLLLPIAFLAAMTFIRLEPLTMSPFGFSGTLSDGNFYPHLSKWRVDPL